PRARKRLIQLGAIAALLSRPVKADSVAFLRSLSRHLDAHDSALDVLDALLREKRLKVRLLAMRRAFRVMLKEAWLAEGAMGVARFASAMWFKTAVNKKQFERYKRLSLLPEGTLGREYWKHMLACGFNFPGEHAGIPTSVSYHDVAHVLAD